MPNETAPRFDHVLNAGAEYELRVILKHEDGTPVDLSVYTASFKARLDFDSGTILFDLNSSTSPSFITMDDEGNLNVDIPASTTAAYVSGIYNFTINVWPTANTDNVRRALEGVIEVRPQVETS